MTSVTEQAIAAGARALDSNYNPDRHPVMAAMFEDYSLTAVRAQWPILSAGLRELHQEEVRTWLRGPDGVVRPEDHCQHCGYAWPCPTMRAIQKIDKELGL